MLRNMAEDGRLSGGQSPASPAGHGVPSGGLVSQDSPWIGLLSVVSRPALSFLHRYLPGGSQTPGTTEGGLRPTGTGFQNRFIDEERDFLNKLDHVMPLQQHAAAHLAYLRCQQERAAGLLEPEPGSAAPWITAASLREIGIEDAEDVSLCPQTPAGYLSSSGGGYLSSGGHLSSSGGHLSSVRTLLSHVLMKPVSAQEAAGAGGSKEVPWWGQGVRGGGDTSHRVLLSDLSRTGDQTKPSAPPAAETRPGLEEWRPGEHSRTSQHKEEPAHNGGLHTQLSPEPEPEPAAGGAQAPLSPDQDNGYSSLEEEHFHLLKGEGTAPSLESEEPSENTEGAEPQRSGQEGRSEGAELPPPQCQNKAIAFIMGCPCSDDDGSQSELSSDDDEDDDDDDAGFDSEGSWAWSDSSASDSDSELDSESQRLLLSLSQSLDPYNPRSFSAPLRSTPPTTIPTRAAPEPRPASPPSASSSPPSDPEAWDDSTSASEAEEAESSRLWNSFSCSSDPYSPLNFQASYRTQGPGQAAPRGPTNKGPRPARPKTASPPGGSEDEGVRRQESVTSDPAPSSSSSSQSSAPTKKVRFCEQVQEIVLGSEEDRRGPWEELARDRCRFQRRCLEVEENIGFCLQPQHRLLVYQRLTVLLQEGEGQGAEQGAEQEQGAESALQQA